MQFLGQIQIRDSEAVDGRLLLLFMCQNNPGLCDEWDPDAGGNAVVAITASDLILASPPPCGSDAIREIRHGTILIDVDADDYDVARAEWAEQTGKSPRAVLGQLGGSPAWMQADETPSCRGCGKPMRFVAQLEQGPDWKSEMNFGGGGCAYLFDCDCVNASAKFLWQC